MVENVGVAQKRLSGCCSHTSYDEMDEGVFTAQGVAQIAAQCKAPPC